MKRTKLLISILVVLCSVLASVWIGKVSKCWAQSKIALSVLGNIIKN